MPNGNTLQIAVCDDSQSDLLEITDMTSHILRQADILFNITEYDNGLSLLSDMQNGRQFHVLLLDVMMSEPDGMEIAAELRRHGDNTQIVFISANREMALRGYEVSAVRYLAKPPEEDKLKEALLYCYRGWQAKKEILLPTEKGLHRTPLADIQYVEAFDRGTRFVLRDDVFETRMKYSEVDAMLPKSDFLLCHRGFIVNLAWVKFIRHYEFVLKSGRTVPVGKGRYAEIHKTFVDYITR